ncbi:MAG: molybdopterin molybdotransferase MoeA [Gemmataceae bacterium]|nr:molybdopterin molybdotransferase MoeA [Gemmataceae bacterium]
MTPFFDVRMKGFRDRAEAADVVRLLDARTAPLPGEPVPLYQAAGRVLAEPVVAAASVPGFARAAMDGYAVRAADTFGADAHNPLPLVVVGEARPAKPFLGTVQPGQAVRIMTGSPVPAGADAVLMAEVARPEPDGRVLAVEPVSPGRHVGRVGEDVAAGRGVLPAGRVLRPQDVGLIASVGVGTVQAVRRPRVALLVTGDELLPPGSMPEGHRIVDSNSPMLAALVARDGGDGLPVQYLPDRYEAVRDAIRDATASADVVLVSGGSSVGAEDHAPRAVAELGELAVHGVALRPASPLGVGILRRVPGCEGERVKGAGGRSAGPAGSPSPSHPHTLPAFLLPGNPVSCLCGYDLFAGRVVRRLGGRGGELPYRRVTLPLASKVVSAIGRVDYVRVRRNGEAVEPVAVSGASILSTAVTADGFVLVDRDREGHAPGEPVEVWLYD